MVFCHIYIIQLYFLICSWCSIKARRQGYGVKKGLWNTAWTIYWCTYLKCWLFIVCSIVYSWWSSKFCVFLYSHGLKISRLATLVDESTGALCVKKFNCKLCCFVLCSVVILSTWLATCCKLEVGIACMCRWVFSQLPSETALGANNPQCQLVVTFDRIWSVENSRPIMPSFSSTGPSLSPDYISTTVCFLLIIFWEVHVWHAIPVLY